MSKTFNRQPVSDPLRETLDDWVPKVAWISGFVTLATVAYLVYVVIGLCAPTPQPLASADVARLAGSIALAGKVFVIALAVLCLCVVAMIFHESITGPVMLFGAAVIYWGVPLLITLFTEGQTAANQHLYTVALQQIRLGAFVPILPGVALIVYQLIESASNRGRHGAKAEQIKYGKGVKEEPEVVYRFLGKCWQLPYCRKFIRVKCPIYLSRKCCWRERVGCMCEEDVIRSAMEGTVQIPKEAVLAAQYIPYNKTLTSGEKAERCRNCIIYNEHQRHKYRLVVPLLIFGIIGPLALKHDEAQTQMNGLLDTLDKVVARFSVAASNTPADPRSMTVFQNVKASPIASEIILICIVTIVLAYSLRAVEYALFKLKI